MFVLTFFLTALLCPFFIFSLFVEVGSPGINFVFTAAFVLLLLLLFLSGYVFLFPSLSPRIRGDNGVMIVILVVMSRFVLISFDM